jgi:hypothetical protein
VQGSEFDPQHNKQQKSEAQKSLFLSFSKNSDDQLDLGKKAHYLILTSLSFLLMGYVDHLFILLL